MQRWLLYLVSLCVCGSVFICLSAVFSVAGECQMSVNSMCVCPTKNLGKSRPANLLSSVLCLDL